MADESDDHPDQQPPATKAHGGVLGPPSARDGGDVDEPAFRDIRRLDRLLALGLLTREEYERATSLILGE